MTIKKDFLKAVAEIMHNYIAEDGHKDREGLRHLKVDTLSRKPKQDLFEDDVIYIDDLRKVKSIMREDEKDI